MTFSEITADVDFLCGTTTASYPIADKTRNINVAYQDTARLIWESSDKWQYDDSNKSTLPVAQSDLFHGQKDYELDTYAQIVRRVEVLDSNGDYVKMKPKDEAEIDIATDEYFSDYAMPIYYDLVGRSVLLYPSPSSAYCTTTDGLQITVERDVDEFATTATTATPGFATQFHRILSYAAAIDYIDDPSVKDRLIAMKSRLEDGLKRFYGRRNQELTTKISPKGKRFWRQYL